MENFPIHIKITKKKEKALESLAMFRPQGRLSFVLTPHTHPYLDASLSDKFPQGDAFLIVIP